jgi:hypothetical protein
MGGARKEFPEDWARGRRRLGGGGVPFWPHLDTRTQCNSCTDFPYFPESPEKAALRGFPATLPAPWNGQGSPRGRRAGGRAGCWCGAADVSSSWSCGGRNARGKRPRTPDRAASSGGKCGERGRRAGASRCGRDGEAALASGGERQTGPNVLRAKAREILEDLGFRHTLGCGCRKCRLPESSVAPLPLAVSDSRGAFTHPMDTRDHAGRPRSSRGGNLCCRASSAPSR